MSRPSSPPAEEEVTKARRRHAMFLGVSALLALGLVVAARAVMLPFVLALVIAYVLTPGVAWVERKRVPRPVAIILVYIFFFGTIGLFVRVSAPRVVQELATFRRELPVLSHTIRSEWVPQVQEKLRQAGLSGASHAAGTEPDGHDDGPALVARPLPDGAFAIELEGPIAINPTRGGGFHIEPVSDLKGDAFDVEKLVADAASKTLSYAQKNALEIVRIGRDIIAGVSRFFLIFGLTLMLAAYTIHTRDRIVAFVASLLRPSSRPSFHALLERMDRGLAGVIRGQLLICVVNGVLSAIGFAIVGLKYWPVLALVATVLSLIPIFGAIISTIPAVVLGLTQSVGTAAFVLVWVVGIHQIEANLLNPKIMGDAAKIHPLLVVFSLLVGEHFFGIVGALLAVPMMSITQSVFLHVRQEVMRADPEMADEVPVSVLPPPPSP